MLSNETVVVIDFGAQYNQLIVRRIREANVFARLLPHNTPVEEIRKINPKAIILSGGPNSVYSPGAPRVDQRIFNEGVPILGICYGMQLMAYQLGGRVRRAEKREYGPAYLEILEDSTLFAGTKKGLDVWMSHGDQVLSLPQGFKSIGRTENTSLAAVGDSERNFYGVQFHPEVAHTPEGQKIITNFLFEIAGCSGDWTEENIIEEKITAIKERVKDGIAICGLSGGVDSAVAARLVQKAIGDRLYCIFINHGLLRADEAEEIEETFNREFQAKLIVVDAQKRFLDKLAGVKDPEEKRRIIGHEFIAVFEEEATKLPDADFLVQGTVYSDVIESGFGEASRIKSHHNVGGLPDRMKLNLVEPLRELFKDEVRRIGDMLGLPPSLVWRQPFPGPGLAVRIIGEITEERLETVRLADKILRQEIKKAGLEREIWQAFAVLPGELRSVGVMGDERTYGSAIVLRAVTSEDAMTAAWARLPYEVLDRVSGRITNEVERVNRVVYDITSKPPGTIEWE